MVKRDCPGENGTVGSSAYVIYMWSILAKCDRGIKDRTLTPVYGGALRARLSLGASGSAPVVEVLGHASWYYRLAQQLALLL